MTIVHDLTNETTRARDELELFLPNNEYVEDDFLSKGNDESDEAAFRELRKMISLGEGLFKRATLVTSSKNKNGTHKVLSNPKS